MRHSFAPAKFSPPGQYQNLRPCWRVSIILLLCCCKTKLLWSLVLQMELVTLSPGCLLKTPVAFCSSIVMRKTINAATIILEISEQQWNEVQSINLGIWTTPIIWSTLTF